MHIISFTSANHKAKSYICMLLCMSFVTLTNTVYAKEGFYGVTSVGYISNEIESDVQVLSLDAASYKISIGYELNKAWSFEAGYQSLGEDIFDIEELTFDNKSYELNSLFVSALGRAGNRYGELFYRIGLMRIDVNETFISAQEQCPESGDTMAILNNVLMCQTSDSKLAGVMGLGFDFFIHHSTLLRIEIEHIKGADKYSSTAAFIGFKLNF